MSRRDTIIIALLVNASLLALLFMLAVNTDEESVVDHPEMSKAIAERPEVISKQSMPVPIALSNTHVNDEVDSFLKDLASEDKGHPITIDDEGYVQLRQEPAEPVRRATSSQNTGDLEYVEVTIKRGDALEKIARNNGTSVEAIKKANNLTSAKLSIGQVLRVPVGKKESQDKPAASTAANTKSKPQQTIAATNKTPKESDVQYYTIKSGDTPWKIAKQYNVPFEDLLKMNGLDEERARNLKIGDKIRVR